ncbi:cytochrome c-type biogenesis CcmH-like mitochondrial protein isoform X1 [Typha latifolia]|uniref:cytochrome c-type biogenesis CcmH-like mitochondrial protein isoform X1 n=1 Tax=Typha latifolia TaxID=4733 RepID=UPI003C2DB0E5
MSTEEDVKKVQIVEARARNISHNVRCTECGSQSIEDSQADVAILLRKLIRDEIQSGKSDKEIYKKLEEDFGETVLYAPKFDLQTAALWLSPNFIHGNDPSPKRSVFHLSHPHIKKEVIVAGAAAGVWAYQRHRQKTNVHIMALNLIRGVPLTPKEKETMIDLLTPPPPPPSRWWWRR